MKFEQCLSVRLSICSNQNCIRTQIPADFNCTQNMYYRHARRAISDHRIWYLPYRLNRLSSRMHIKQPFCTKFGNSKCDYWKLFILVQRVCYEYLPYRSNRDNGILGIWNSRFIFLNLVSRFIYCLSENSKNCRSWLIRTGTFHMGQMCQIWASAGYL